MKIAVCDDEKIFMEHICAIIQKSAEKYNVECSIQKFESGKELLCAYKKDYFDAVFLDVAMPELDGFNVAKKIEELRNDAMVVFVSNKEQMVFSSYGHTALAKKSGTSYYYYLYNAHGDVTAIVDESGNIVNSYEYTPWGEIASQTETVENSVKYAGEYYDEENGLIYLRNRYYDPNIRRFTSEDPARDEWNWYCYCGNNPIMFVDPTGLIPSLEDAAAMADHVYQLEKFKNDKEAYKLYMSRNNLAARKVGDGWRLIDTWFGSEGLVIGIYVRGDGEYSSYTGHQEYAFVNKGSSTLGDWVNNVQQPFGFSTDMQESINSAKYFANGNWGNYEITFIGHSKGGAEAAANAIATNRNAILFNPAELSVINHGFDILSYNANMTAYVVAGEPLSMVNSFVKYGIPYQTKLLPFYSLNPIKNHSMEAVKSGVKGK